VITYSEPRKPAPPVRNPVYDWHALDFDEQDEVLKFRLTRVMAKNCSTRAKLFIQRHEVKS
jgi:hypothetical protein